MKLKTREAVMGYVFALPSLSGFTLFLAVPFGISIYYCFTGGIAGTGFVGLDNFRDLLKSGSFLLASRNTLVFNLISVPSIMVLSFLMAVLLNRKLKGMAFFRTLFVIPLVIPVASIILVWQIIFNEHGTLNHLLVSFGIEPQEWMRSDWSLGVLALVYMWKNCGYNVILFLAGLGSIPKEYYESAKIDGAGRRTCMFRITIPFLIPTTFFVFIISMINSFKVFREAYVLAGSYPYPKIYLLQHFMNNNFFNLSYQRLTTAAFLMILAICILVFAFFMVERRFGRDFG